MVHFLMGLIGMSDEKKYREVSDASRVDKYMAQLLAADIISAGTEALPLCMGNDSREELMLMADLAMRACRAVDEMAESSKYWNSGLKINAMRKKRGSYEFWPDDE